MESLLYIIGRLHPLMVHFPIGLLVIALVFEVMTLKGKHVGLRDGITLLVYFGAIAAILSSVFGYMLSINEGFSGDLLILHKRLGIATSILASITSLLLFKSSRNDFQKLLSYRVMLCATVIGVSFAGHFGASLTHGKGYLFGGASAEKSDYDIEDVKATVAEFSVLDTLTLAQQDKLNIDVRSIVAHNCYQCHSEYKKKGELALDSKRDFFKGGESGEVVIPGNAQASELYKRIILPSNHKELMPKKGKTLAKSEIQLIELWIKHGAHWSDQAVGAFTEAPLALSQPKLPISSEEAHPIDQLVGQYFRDNNVRWPSVVDDRAFVRRAHLDIIGLLPSPEIAQSFIDDDRGNKREVLIDNLLSQNQGYTEHWLSFWNDLLRNDYSGPGFITGGRKEITNWLYESLMSNNTYDSMLMELLNPTPESEGFIKGIEWRGVVNSSQRTEMQAAQNIGQSIMGVNVKCASCHNSFVSNLTLKQAYGFASVFADTLLELNRCDMPTGVMSKVSFLYNELGSVEAETVDERLELLSEVVVKPENGRLYRTFTNRIWKILLGRGFVEPADEMDNPPWSNEVLDWLASDFRDSGSDIKHLIRTIMTSKTYQLNTSKFSKQEDLKKSSYVFDGPVMRRLSAEQYADAISQVISPMFYGVGYDPSGEGLSSNRIWHKERKFDRDVLPEPGKRYFRHDFEVPKNRAIAARALLSVDHSYTFYINGRKVSEGSDWRKVQKIDVVDYLKEGNNIIAIEASNEGQIANPAGILFALRLTDADSLETILQANTSWLSSATEQNRAWTTDALIQDEWHKVKNYGSSHWDKLLDFTFDSNNSDFARASLVKQHPFLKALGRPTRENVATTRDDQATLLQALELTNGEFLSGIIAEGADNWLEKYGKNSSLIVDQLFIRVFARSPSDSEKRTLLKAIGKEPTKESIQDLFWSVLMLPEFQFIS